VFNGELPRPEKLTDVNNIPKKLLEPFVKLIGANPKSRPSPANFISGESLPHIGTRTTWRLLLTTPPPHFYFYLFVY
jgi:hypothetical protein